MIRVAAILVAILLSTVVSGAVTAEPEIPSADAGPRLVLAGSVDLLGRGHLGGTGSLDLVYPLAVGHTLLAGLEWREADELEWIVGRAGIGGTIHGPWYGEAQLQVGPGRLARERFTYWKTRLVFGRRIGDRVGLDLAHSYLDIHDTQGHLLVAGAWFAALDHWTIRLDLSQIVAGDLDTRSVAARTDLDLGLVRFLLGGAYGETRAELVGLSGAARPDAIQFREVYAGLEVPWRGIDFGLIASHLFSDSTDRTSVQLIVDVPLARLREVLP